MNWYKFLKFAERLCLQGPEFMNLNNPNGMKCIEVFWNPDRSTFKSLLKETYLVRGFVFPGKDKVILWDGGTAGHGSVLRALENRMPSIKNAIPIYADNGTIIVTDFSNRTGWTESPEASSRIRKNKAVKGFMGKNLDVDCYNSAIVGDWENLEKRENEIENKDLRAIVSGRDMSVGKNNNKVKIAEKSLYHGTILDNLSSIREVGLVPELGDFVKDMYGPEYEAAGIDIEDHFTPLPFAADKENIDNAVTAMIFQVSKKLEKGYHDVTLNDIRNHGLIVKVKGKGGPAEPPSPWEQRPDFDENYEFEMESSERGLHSVEPGDYFTEYPSAKRPQRSRVYNWFGFDKVFKKK